MEVQLVKNMRDFEWIKLLLLRKLRLNVDDIYQLNYILEDAEIVE